MGGCTSDNEVDGFVGSDDGTGKESQQHRKSEIQPSRNVAGKFFFMALARRISKTLGMPDIAMDELTFAVQD